LFIPWELSTGVK